MALPQSHTACALISALAIRRTAPFHPALKVGRRLLIPLSASVSLAQQQSDRQCHRQHPEPDAQRQHKRHRPKHDGHHPVPDERTDARPCQREDHRHRAMSYPLKDALTEFTAGLHGYVAATVHFDDRHPRLALDHGLAVHQASLRWTRQAIATLRGRVTTKTGLDDPLPYCWPARTLDGPPRRTERFTAQCTVPGRSGCSARAVQVPVWAGWRRRHEPNSFMRNRCPPIEAGRIWGVPASCQRPPRGLMM
jgi:hypothetical protein